MKLLEKISQISEHLPKPSFDGEVNRMFGANPRALLDTDNQTLKIAYETLFKKLVGQQSET